MKFKQVGEPKAKEVPSAFCGGEGAFLGSLLNCGVLVQQCCAYPNQIAFARNPLLSLCIFKNCLIKATLANKLHLLDIYLHLPGSAEFSVLEKIKTYFMFFGHWEFLMFVWGFFPPQV